MTGRLISRGLLFLSSCYLVWCGVARIARGGDFAILGWPLLTLGVAGAVTAAASVFLGRRARRRLEMCACLLSSVPFVLMAYSIYSLPDHGELGGLLVFPLLGAALLLVVAAAVLGVLGWRAKPGS